MDHFNPTIKSFIKLSFQSFKNIFPIIQVMIDIVLSPKEDLKKTGKKLGYKKVVYYKELNIKFGFNRNFFESKKTEIITSLETSLTKDKTHFKDSGLNHVLCKLAKKNNIAIAFNFNNILNAKKQYIILGRIRQNIMLCRKYKIPMIIVSFANTPFEMRNPKDFISLGISLGMTPIEAKNAVSKNVEAILYSKNPNILAEGIKIVS